MNDNYNFLGTISAIYNFSNNDENYYITIAVFSNANSLKIFYKDLAISGLSKTTNEGKIILEGIGKREMNLITTSFSERLIKNLVLSKFVDYIKMDITFEVIY